MKEVCLLVNPCNSVKHIALKIMAVLSHYITVCQEASCTASKLVQPLCKDFQKGSQDGVASIVTRLTPGGSRICLLAGTRDLLLLKNVQIIFWAHPPSYSVGRGPKQLRHEAEHSLTPSARKLYFHSPTCLHGTCRENLTLPYHF